MRFRRHVVAASAALALCTLSLRADADSARAWAVAKDNLPANATTVIGADLTAITKSALFNQLMPLALTQADVKKPLDLVKAACKFDPLTAVHGAVIAFGEDRGSGVIFLSLGVDQPKLMKCLEDVAKASGDKGAKVAAKKTGALTEIAIGADKLYVSWFGTDVVAVALRAEDKGALEKWIGGKGAFGKTAAGKHAASANTKAALWGATSNSTEPEPGMKIKGGHGALTITGGNLTIDLRAMLDSPKAATDAAAKATADLAKAVKGSDLPDAVKAIAKQTSIKAVGAELAMKTTVAENAVMPLITQLMMGGGF